MKNINMFMSDEVAAKVNTGEAYKMPEEKYVALRSEMMDLLTKFDYHPTEEGLDVLLKIWLYRKANIIRIFEQHPFYNGNFQIVRPDQYTRGIDYDTINRFLNLFYSWVTCHMLDSEKEYKNSAFTYQEVRQAIQKIIEKLDVLKQVEWLGMQINVRSERGRLNEDLAFFRSILKDYTDKIDVSHILFNGRVIAMEPHKRMKNYAAVLNKAKFRTSNKTIGQFVDDEMHKYVENISSEIDAPVGQKISRFINRLAKETGFDKEEGYNKEFCVFADAINPLNIPRWTVISCNPIDYLTMSFGNSWSSCHTIDRNNKRNKPGDTYHGMYSGGTTSYMEDSSSFIVYSVDKNVTEKYELADKIQRCMFMIGEGKLIQSRMYPQATDGDTDKYLETRKIVEEVISQCLGMPNSWVKAKSGSAADGATYQVGEHYNDLEAFANDGVGLYYQKDAEGNIHKDFPKIRVGAVHHCPSCGKVHYERGNIECYDCQKDYTRSDARTHTARYMSDVDRELSSYENCPLGECEDGDDIYERCSCCDRELRRDEMHEIDGEWYCEECCFWCEYCQEWETGDSYYVAGYGNICEYACNESGEFAVCTGCGELYRLSSWSVETENYCFCSEDCARDDGNVVFTQNDGWQERDDCVFDAEDSDYCDLESEAEDYGWVYIECADEWYMTASRAIDAGYVKTNDCGWKREEDCTEIVSAETGEIIYYYLNANLVADSWRETEYGIWRQIAIA